MTNLIEEGNNLTNDREDNGMDSMKGIEKVHIVPTKSDKKIEESEEVE